MELPTLSADGHPVDLRLFVQNVFLKPGELYPEDLPLYWKPYLACAREKHPDCDDPNKDRNTQGYPPKVEPEHGMTYPQVTHREEPEYTRHRQEGQTKWHDHIHGCHRQRRTTPPSRAHPTAGVRDG